MWIKQNLFSFLAVLGLGGAVLLLSAPSAWACGGGGGGGAGVTYTIQYSDEEEATDEPKGYSFSAKYDYKFSSSLDLNFVYEYEMEPEQEETETPTLRYYSPMWGSTTPYGMMMRFEYRFRPMEVESLQAVEEEEPAFSLSKIEYRFSTWVDNDTLEAIDEDPLKGLDPERYVWDEDEGLGIRVGDYIMKVNMTPEAARAFQDWEQDKDPHKKVEEFLGDDVYDQFQQQFGDQDGGDTVNGGGTDQSPWASNRIYCGATCVHSYYE